MRRSSILAAVAAALAVGTAACVPGPPGPPPGGGNQPTDCATRTSRGGALSVVGLVNDGTLVCFKDSNPSSVDKIGLVSGLVQDVSLVGIDYRPANNTLYGVGNAGGIYTIDAGTATATFVARISEPLQGTSFGVDFNPAVDRLRVISDTGQNLRINPDTGAGSPADGALNLPAATPPVNPALGVTGAAYTNNDADPMTATTLFDIDTTNDNVVIQAPANAGALSPTGKLGVDASATVGFDIYSKVTNGTTVSLRPLAAITTTDGTYNLYSVDLLIGRVSAIGSFDRPVVDIAIPTAQS